MHLLAPTFGWPSASGYRISPFSSYHHLLIFPMSTKKTSEPSEKPSPITSRLKWISRRFPTLHGYCARLWHSFQYCELRSFTLLMYPSLCSYKQPGNKDCGLPALVLRYPIIPGSEQTLQMCLLGFTEYTSPSPWLIWEPQSHYSNGRQSLTQTNISPSRMLHH